MSEQQKKDEVQSISRGEKFRRHIIGLLADFSDSEDQEIVEYTLLYLLPYMAHRQLKSMSFSKEILEEAIAAAYPITINRYQLYRFLASEREMVTAVTSILLGKDLIRKEDDGRAYSWKDEEYCWFYQSLYLYQEMLLAQKTHEVPEVLCVGRIDAGSMRTLGELFGEHRFAGKDSFSSPMSPLESWLQEMNRHAILPAIAVANVIECMKAARKNRLVATNFDGLDLSEARLFGVDMHGASLVGAKLSPSCFAGRDTSQMTTIAPGGNLWVEYLFEKLWVYNMKSYHPRTVSLDLPVKEVFFFIDTDEEFIILTMNGRVARVTAVEAAQDIDVEYLDLPETILDIALTRAGEDVYLLTESELLILEPDGTLYYADMPEDMNSIEADMSKKNIIVVGESGEYAVFNAAEDDVTLIASGYIETAGKTAEVEALLGEYAVVTLHPQALDFAQAILLNTRTGESCDLPDYKGYGGNTAFLDPKRIVYASDSGISLFNISDHSAETLMESESAVEAMSRDGKHCLTYGYIFDLNGQALSGGDIALNYICNTGISRDGKYMAAVFCDNNYRPCPYGNIVVRVVSTASNEYCRTFSVPSDIHGVKEPRWSKADCCVSLSLDFSEDDRLLRLFFEKSDDEVVILEIEIFGDEVCRLETTRNAAADLLGTKEARRTAAVHYLDMAAEADGSPYRIELDDEGTYTVSEPLSDDGMAAVMRSDDDADLWCGVVDLNTGRLLRSFFTMPGNIDNCDCRKLVGADQNLLAFLADNGARTSLNPDR